MGVLLRVLLVAGGIYLLYRLWRRLHPPQGERLPPNQPHPLIACASCGAMIPVETALRRDGRAYCPQCPPPS
ncbi:MAG: hypothetical protein HQL51_04545 [Magnetococcales bacterium]|nr:hypothetical protein [Magnetococcales bacterium]